MFTWLSSRREGSDVDAPAAFWATSCLDCQAIHRAFTSDSFWHLAFQYEPDIEYYAHSKVVIGAMDKECSHCHALKFKNEPPGMCCASGKVQLPEIETPPEPLNGLLIGTDPDSNVFLKSIRTFNSCFQMTSFGATEIQREALKSYRLLHRTDRGVGLGKCLLCFRRKEKVAHIPAGIVFSLPVASELSCCVGEW
ncbi:hypothetical protein C0J52_22899 [Blattella germanica]|nr:hypothetical protein C0J52_22899 [Blattella germanica]